MAAMTDHQSPAHLRHIGRGGSQNLIASVVAALLGILLSIVVARSFSTEDTGLYFTATSVVLLIATVARLGTSIGLVYWISRLRELGRVDDLHQVLRIALRPVFALSIVTAIALIAVAPWASDLFLDGSSTGTRMLQLLALALPAIVVFDALLGATRGLGTMKPTAVLDRIGRPAAQLALTVIAALMGSVVAATAAWAIPYLVLVLIVGWWVFRRVKAPERSLEPEPEPEPELELGQAEPQLRRDFWSFTWPRAITSVVQQARQRFDIVFVSAISGPAEAGLYAIATRFLVVGQLTNSALALAAQPHVASLSTSDQRGSIAAVYRSTTTWIITLNGPLYVGVAIFSPLLLSLFGPDYVSAWPVTVTMCVAAFIGNGSGMVDVILSMTGRTSATLANSLGALVTQVVLLVALVPTWGAFGAAIAWGVSIVVINAMSVVQLARSDGIHPLETGTAFAVAGNLVAVAIPAGAIALALGQTWAAFALSVAVCAAAYVGFARIFRRQLHLPELMSALRRSR